MSKERRKSFHKDELTGNHYEHDHTTGESRWMEKSEVNDLPPGTLRFFVVGWFAILLLCPVFLFSSNYTKLMEWVHLSSFFFQGSVQVDDNDGAGSSESNVSETEMVTINLDKKKKERRQSYKDASSGNHYGKSRCWFSFPTFFDGRRNKKTMQISFFFSDFSHSFTIFQNTTMTLDRLVGWRQSRFQHHQLL